MICLTFHQYAAETQNSQEAVFGEKIRPVSVKVCVPNEVLRILKMLNKMLYFLLYNFPPKKVMKYWLCMSQTFPGEVL